MAARLPTVPGIILVLNRRKRHDGEILLINASNLRSKGRPEDDLEGRRIGSVAGLDHGGKAEPGVSAVVGKDQAVKNDDSLSSSRDVTTGGAEEILPPEEAAVL